VDALSAAASGLQATSSWFSAVSADIASSDGAPDPQDAAAAYVQAPIAYAVDAKILHTAAALEQSLIDTLA
jgi:hypothetical protein